MASRTYNNFHLGLGQDDHKTGGPRFIDSSNLTGLTDGYGVTLGPKTNKLLYTNSAMRGFLIRPLTQTANDDYHLAFGDSGEIYNLGSSTDNTPAYTFSNGGRVRAGFELGSYYYFLYENTPGTTTLNLAQVTRVDVFNGTWASMNELYDFGFINHIDNPPVLLTANIAYIGGLDVVKNIDSSGVIGTSFTGVNRYVQGISKHYTQFTLYTTSNEVYYVSEAEILSGGIQSGSNILNYQPRRQVQDANNDYLLSREGQFFIGSGINTQEFSKPRLSERLNDNSDYKSIFNFDIGDEIAGDTMAFARDKLYIANNGDTQPGIYVYGRLIPGVNKSFHKIATTASNGEVFEKVYGLTYEHTQNRLYYSYKTASNYGVDYIEVDTKEANTTGYGITEVFSANTGYEKKVKRLRFTTSNTSGNKNIKLYTRVNNGAWELERTINTTEDTVQRVNISTQKSKNIDLQFKFELNNPDGTNQPPFVHELVYDYDIIET